MPPVPVAPSKPEQAPARGKFVPTSFKDGVTPQEHQVSAVKKLFSNGGKIVLTAPPGSGKTLTAILGQEALKDAGRSSRALVIVPSGLRSNFAQDGIQKFTNATYQIIGGGDESRPMPGVTSVPLLMNNKDYTIVSYEMFKRAPEEIIARSGADTLICDEYHKARNEATGLFKTLARVRGQFKNFMGITASPVNNDVSELASLLSLSEGKRIATPAQFKQAFTETVGFSSGFSGGKVKERGLKNTQQLMELIYPKMDYLTYDQLKGDKVMPRKEIRNVEVPMTQQQWDLYQLALDRLGPEKEQILRGDPNVSLKDAKIMFVRMAQARQVANSVGRGVRDINPEASSQLTPKAMRIVADTEQHLSQDPKNSVVLYSNLVNGGVDVLLAGLRKKGIDPAIFIGKGAEVDGQSITSNIREKGLQEYKDGKKRVIVLSGAGAEGLDLRNSTAFFAYDGHFNPERILQAEARARRLGGQEFRAPEKRVVDVRRYMSVAPPNAQQTETGGFFSSMFRGDSGPKPAPFTTDQWMYRVAGKKFGKTQQLYDALKQPYKYIRKYPAADGTMRYVYPDKDGNAVVSAIPPPAKY